MINPAFQAVVGFTLRFNPTYTCFGDNGIDLRVGFWVRDPDNGFLGMFSDILLTVWRRFKEEGIEFPYPQREVRILNEADGRPTPPDALGSDKP